MYMYVKYVLLERSNCLIKTLYYYYYKYYYIWYIMIIYTIYMVYDGILYGIYIVYHIPYIYTIYGCWYNVTNITLLYRHIYIYLWYIFMHITLLT